MENHRTHSLREQITELFHTSLRDHDVLTANDVLSVRTLKLMLVGQVLTGLGFDWGSLTQFLQKHAIVHPTVARDLVKPGEEDAANTLAQVFVRNAELMRLVKTIAQTDPKKVERLMAVDGLAGTITHGPNFELKHYIGNLRIASSPDDGQTFFDPEPDFKRLHVRVVRDLHDRLKHVPVPAKQIYEIVRRSALELVGTAPPEVDWMEEEVMDLALQAECGRLYMKAMGRDRLQSLVDTLKFKGEKRPALEREEESGTEKRAATERNTPSPDDDRR